MLPGMDIPVERLGPCGLVMRWGPVGPRVIPPTDLRLRPAGRSKPALQVLAAPSLPGRLKLAGPADRSRSTRQPGSSPVRPMASPARLPARPLQRQHQGLQASSPPATPLPHPAERHNARLEAQPADSRALVCCLFIRSEAALRGEGTLPSASPSNKHWTHHQVQLDQRDRPLRPGWRITG